jgi:tetratricopeptide (TPR) repeat protein
MDMDETAVYWLERLEALEDPFYALPAYWVGLALNQGRLEEARRGAAAWVQDYPEDLFARELNALTAMFIRDVETARAEFESLYRDVPDWSFGWISTDIRAGLAWAFLEQGEEDRAHQLLGETREWLEGVPGGVRDETGALYGLALVSALSGNKEEALARLEEAADNEGGGGYRQAATDPRFDNISEDPRFEALMERMKADVDSMRARLERGDVELPIGG